MTFTLPESRWFRLHGGPRNGQLVELSETMITCGTVFFPVKQEIRASDYWKPNSPITFTDRKTDKYELGCRNHPLTYAGRS